MYMMFLQHLETQSDTAGGGVFAVNMMVVPMFLKAVVVQADKQAKQASGNCISSKQRSSQRTRATFTHLPFTCSWGQKACGCDRWQLLARCRPLLGGLTADPWLL